MLNAPQLLREIKVNDSMECEKVRYSGDFSLTTCSIHFFDLKPNDLSCLENAKLPVFPSQHNNLGDSKNNSICKPFLWSISLHSMIGFISEGFLLFMAIRYDEEVYALWKGELLFTGMRWSLFPHHSHELNRLDNCIFFPKREKTEREILN